MHIYSVHRLFYIQAILFYTELTAWHHYTVKTNVKT